ncbi:cyclic nucleotide-binding/CBS domain-containing protein [Pseudomonadota bacterium]
MLTQKIAHFIANQDILSMPPTSSVADAAIRMAERHLGAVLVTDGDNLLGIFTERDLLEKVIARSRSPKDTELGEVMSHDPTSVAPTDTMLTAILTMKEQMSRHLLVRDRGRIIGIVSVRDVLRAVVVERTEDHQHLENLWEGFPV